jgi:hypothetical protein
MAYSIAWDASSPVGSSTNANTIDTEFQNLKTSIQERMNNILSNAWETDANDPKAIDVSAIAGQPDVALVYSSATLTLVTATPLILLWNTETLDTGNPTTEFHSTSTNTGRMTITTAGYYRIVGLIQIYAGANAGDVTLRLKKNGTSIRASLDPVIALDNMTMHINEVVLAAAADYYELEGEQASGVNMSVIGGATTSMFSIERINGTT